MQPSFLLFQQKKHFLSGTVTFPFRTVKLHSILLSCPSSHHLKFHFSERKLEEKWQTIEHFKKKKCLQTTDLQRLNTWFGVESFCASYRTQRSSVLSIKVSFGQDFVTYQIPFPQNTWKRTNVATCEFYKIKPGNRRQLNFHLTMNGEHKIWTVCETCELTLYLLSLMIYVSKWQRQVAQKCAWNAGKLQAGGRCPY